MLSPELHARAHRPSAGGSFPDDRRHAESLRWSSDALHTPRLSPPPYPPYPPFARGEKSAASRLFPPLRTDLWPQLCSDVNCIVLWTSSEKILTRLYSVLHWFHKRLEVNVKNPRENRCFHTVIVFSFDSIDNPNKCPVLVKIAARLITVSTSVNNEMWVKLSILAGRRGDGHSSE